MQNLKMSLGSWCFASCIDRFATKGYKSSLSLDDMASQIRQIESLVVEGDSTIKSGGRAGKELLARKDPPTAIFASNDLMAIGAMKELQEHGLKVPENVSIIGFDDIPTASLVTPALTTIAQPKYEMGVEAMNLLIRMIEKKGVPKSKVVLDTQLVVRESTKRLI